MARYEEMTQRNIGILSCEQQGKLRQSTVAIAGVGGVGGLTAERLVRLGIGGLKIADPEVFEPTNFNRQLGSGISTLGVNKAEVIGGILRDINRDLRLTVWNVGINEQNADEFVEGVDIVIDEIEYAYPVHSIILHRAARRQGKYVMFALAIGFGSNLFVFDPDGMTFEEYLSLPEDSDYEQIRNFVIPVEKMCPIIPEYVDKGTVSRIIRGEQPYLPTVSVGCSVAGSLIAAEVAALLLDLRPPRVMPEVVMVDLIRQEITPETKE